MAIIPTLQERILRSFAHDTQRPGDRAWVPSRACGLQIQWLPHNPSPPRSVFSGPENPLSMPRGAQSLLPGRQGCRGTRVKAQDRGDGGQTLAPEG